MTPASSPLLSRIRRLPWIAIALTLLLVAGGIWSRAPLRDAATLGGVGEVTLGFPGSYYLLAPAWDILDQLTLLTIPQHIALLLTLIVLFVLWRKLRRGSTTAGRELRVALACFAAFIAVYVVGAVLKRPMAAISIEDPTVIAVDFHAHTKFSHDGRMGWTAEDVRDWHDGAGFTAAYVTDHRSVEGAAAGAQQDPPVAGEGTTLLPGIEVVWNGAHVNLLSVESHYRGLTNPTLRDVDPEALTLASMVRGGEPVVVQTIPDDIAHMPPVATAPGTAGIRAIEVIDGAPRGLLQSRRDRAKIVHLADSLDITLVAGSDNHGWGRTAPGWTLMRVPGWRGMTPDSLAEHIENTIRFGRRNGTRVVERVATPGTAPLEIALTAPLLAWNTVATLDAERRTAWLIWTWGLVVVLWAVRLARARRNA